MYNKIILMGKFGMLPLSNDFDEIEKLKRAISNCADLDVLSNIINRFYKYGRIYPIINDMPGFTTVEFSDKIGNISKLIIYKGE